MIRSTSNQCIACADSIMVEYFSAAEFPHLDERFGILRCERCGMGRTDPMLPADEIGDWYGEEYYGEMNRRFHSFIEVLIKKFRDRRTSLIRKYSRVGPVLDVGCGRGLTLGNLKSFGYQPFGIELSDQAAQHAREVVGAEVFVGDICEAPYPEESFEVVILWHSLEHFDDPVSVLERAHSLLKPEGLIAIAVPNFGSLQSRVAKTSWFHLDLPRHYYHFSLRSLCRLLDRFSFEPLKTSTLSLEMNPYGWLQSAYNGMGLPNNLLYSCLKNKSARGHALSQYPAPLLAMAISLPVLAPLSFVLAGLEAITVRGGSVEVLAQKRA